MHARFALPGSIAALNRAGYKVAICTNQAEIGRGVLTVDQVRRIHDALTAMLRARGARIEHVFCCGTLAKSPFKKPAGGMLRDAMKRFGAVPRTTFFVGDQKADLQAAFHARCRAILVRTGMGAKTLAAGLPAYLQPVEAAAALTHSYPHLEEVVWAQEEPQNMGAWRAIRHRLEESLAAGVRLRFIGRPWRASPSEGYPTAHLVEQDRIAREALA